MRGYPDELWGTLHYGCIYFNNNHMSNIQVGNSRVYLLFKNKERQRC